MSFLNWLVVVLVAALVAVGVSFVFLTTVGGNSRSTPATPATPADSVVTKMLGVWDVDVEASISSYAESSPDNWGQRQDELRREFTGAFVEFTPGWEFNSIIGENRRCTIKHVDENDGVVGLGFPDGLGWNFVMTGPDSAEYGRAEEGGPMMVLRRRQ